MSGFSLKTEQYFSIGSTIQQVIPWFNHLGGSVCFIVAREMGMKWRMF